MVRCVVSHCQLFGFNPFLHFAFPAPASTLVGHKSVMSPALQFTVCPLPATASQILPVYPHHIICLAFFLDHASLEMKADAFLKMLGTAHSVTNGSVTPHKTLSPHYEIHSVFILLCGSHG